MNLPLPPPEKAEAFGPPFSAFAWERETVVKGVRSALRPARKAKALSNLAMQVRRTAAI